MRVVLGISHRDKHLAKDLLTWMNELDPKPSGIHHLVLACGARVRQDDINELSLIAKPSFVSVAALRLRDESERSWPNACNQTFQSAVTWIKENGGGYFYFMEPDVVPMVPNWRETLEAEYLNCGKPFMGAVYDQPYKHLNGSMVYPDNISKHNIYMLHATNQPWDLTRPELTMRLGHNTPLIQRTLADPKTNTPFTFPDLPSLRFVREGVILFHGCKDGSLTARLREQRGGAPVVNGNLVRKKLPQVVRRTWQKITGESSYYHSGNLGDIIYALYAIKLAGGGDLLIGPERKDTPPCTNPINADQFALLRPLLEKQTFIKKLAFRPTHPLHDVEHDLNAFREHNPHEHLTKAHCRLLGVEHLFKDDAPWLTVEDPIWTGKIIVNRTARYRSTSFPWKEMVRKYADQMLFIGHSTEHKAFCQEFESRISFYESRDFMELARVIKGGQCFVGNESFPLSIAIGMGQRIYCEQFTYPNEKQSSCFFARETYIDHRKAGVQEFGKWLNCISEAWIAAPPVRKRTVVIRRSSSLGDVLAATCVATHLSNQGFDIHWQAMPEMHPLLRRHPKIKSYSEPSGDCDINLDGCYETDPNRCKRHFADMFIEKANLDLQRHGIAIPKVINYAPRINSDEPLRKRIEHELRDHPRPWVFICPRSNSFINRTVPNAIWTIVAPQIHGTKFWLGNDPAPQGIVDVQCRTVESLVEFIAAADLLITVDSGPLHIAASLGTPIVAINQASSPAVHLSNQRDWICVEPDLNCLNCQQNACPLDPQAPPCQRIPPELIVNATNARLRSVTTMEVSASIAVFKPDMHKLNRAIEAVGPQVSEIVVTGDLDTPWPLKLVNNPKVKAVRMPAKETGYGRKQNYGIRHTNGRFIMMVNDDCYLEPDVVNKCREQMHEDVAVVSHLLLYPNHTIQYCGKQRPAGAMCFGHINLKMPASRVPFKNPVEQESVCGCSILVRREAFYEVNGFDERYRLTSEDDHLAMAVRQAGWRVIFHPGAMGIHEEHASVKKTVGFEMMMREASAEFAQYWKEYFKHNPNPHLVGNFNYVKR
jgi:ADP-heptose:LPS heptosyltransferase/GT2 family glycosyltransferase